MSLQLRNDIVLISSEDGSSFSVYRSNDDQLKETVGTVKLTGQDSVSVEVEIAEEFRGQHFASNAVYLVTVFAHEQMQVNEIRVELDESQEMALHILEHAGYQREFGVKEIIYTHHAEKTDDATNYMPAEGLKVLFLAGGCFWGTQRAFDVLRGVVESEVGYANGHVDHPTYEMICRNETGYRETVRVTYDPKVLSIETLLKAYFIVTDPTKENQQGNDIGSQYQSGIYWRDDADAEAVLDYLDKEKEKYPSFHVEAKKLESFYLAEEYHQDYLVKNPDGYCHVTRIDLEEIKRLNS